MPSPSPRPAVVPPEPPFMGDASQALTNHLRSLALWAKNQLAAKIDSQTSQEMFLYHGHDAPKDVTPNVYKFQIRNDGVPTVTPVNLGTPATPDIPGPSNVPLVLEAPTDGGLYARTNAGWAAAAPASTVSFPEAPTDGQAYARMSSSWTPALPLAGGTMTGALTAPTTTVTGLATVQFQTFSTLPANAATDAAAASAGVPVGGVYRNGSVLMVRTV